ncbi:hypothetical protein [Streptomyces torulosus]|uniref:hypothetical protein n=1 Tax=Streptomyces torulosus TaxID=68276 RepID=UPI0006EB6BBC|nr:hypothetical protein [Streptomyces torulosus]
MDNGSQAGEIVLVELRNVRETTIGTIKQLTSLGTVALIALVAAAVLAVRAVVLRPEMRRNTSIAWAFGVFWPRASHPFAPAAWTARAVPELTHRIKHLLDSDTDTGTDTRILVHAHSMGAAFAVAALWQIPSALRPRIALLTTGSPISRVFKRHYPGYVTVESLESLVRGGEGDEGLGSAPGPTSTVRPTRWPARPGSVV